MAKSRSSKCEKTFSARQPRRLSATVRGGFGSVNHGGSRSPKAGTGQEPTFLFSATPTLERLFRTSERSVK
jgi:hypothetical protein